MKLIPLFLFAMIQLLSCAEIRIGLIGLDTSHVVAFTKLLNEPKNPLYVPGGKVIAAYKGGSPDIESSWSRLEDYTKQLQQEFGIKMVGSIEELCYQVDAVKVSLPGLAVPE